MATYNTNVKRQKTTATTINSKQLQTSTSYSAESDVINRIEYSPNSGVDEVLTYRYYNPTELVYGRALEDWFRPSVSFDHAIYETVSSKLRKREEVLPQDTTESRQKKLKSGFELCSKLQVKYWSISDVNLLPPNNQDQSQQDEILDYVLELQARTNIKLQSFVVDLSSDPRYADGSFSSSDATTVSIVGAQLKRALDTAQKLGAGNLLIRNKTDGFGCLLDTDLARELRNYSRLLKMAAEYRDHIGYRGQLVLEPAGRHRLEQSYTYNDNIFSTICFLKHYGLERVYKLNVQPDISAIFTNFYGFFGSFRVTNEDINMKEIPLALKNIIEQGGFQLGGTNFSLTPTRRAEIRDIFALYISRLDQFAHALRIAVKILQDDIFTRTIQRKYSSFHNGWGSRFSNGEASLADCEDQSKRVAADQTILSSQTSQYILDRYTQINLK